MTTAEDGFDDRYVRFREHADVRERVTALESDKVQVAASLSRIEAMLNARSPAAAAAPQETAAALALHRALDAFDKRPSSNESSPIKNTLAMIGAIALGAVVMLLFDGNLQ